MADSRFDDLRDDFMAAQAAAAAAVRAMDRMPPGPDRAALERVAVRASADATTALIRLERASRGVYLRQPDALPPL